MIDRFKLCRCCKLMLIMLFVSIPFSASESDATPDGSTRSPNSSPHEQARKIAAPIHSNTSQLLVNMTAGRESVLPGDTVGYGMTVTNTASDATAKKIRIFNVPPAGFTFKGGSFQLNGINSPDPAVSADGKAFILIVGDLEASGSATIRFEADVARDSKPGKAVNYASAINSGGGSSNIARASVLVKESELPSKANQPDPTPAVKVSEANVQTPEAVSITAPPPPALPTQSESQKVSADVRKTTDEHAATTLSVSESRNLAELVGKSDISVLADADGQFVKNMSDNQIIEKESALQVGEANLLESIRAGRNFNRESLAALARTEQAKAQTGQAFALLLPSVSVRASSGSETSQPSVNLDATGNPLDSDTHSRSDVALTVRQPLFDLPGFQDWRRRKVIEQARGENFRVNDGDAYVSAVNAYLSLVSSRLQTDMTREFEFQLNELLIYVEKRANAGAASISDMSRVRARSQATRSSRLEQESAHAAAGIEFVRLTNVVPRKIRLPVLGDVGASLLPQSLEMAVAEAMKSNPDIAALTAEFQAAEIDKSTAKSRYLPRVDAEYTDSFSLHAGGDPSSSGQRDKRLMAVLNWSLFSGGSDYQNHVERTARHKELHYRLDDQRRRVVQALSANYALLATTRERISSGYQELASISTAAEAMSKRMLSGNQSLLDVLDVYDRFYQVRSRLVNLHILEMSTVVQLVRLTRGAPEISKAGIKLSASALTGSTTAPVPLADAMGIRGDGDSDILAKLKAGALSLSGSVKPGPSAI